MVLKTIMSKNTIALIQKTTCRVLLLKIICDPNQGILIAFILVSAKLIILDAIFFSLTKVTEDGQGMLKQGRYAHAKN